METSTTVRSGVYRRHNGTKWEKIYFETSANLVHETDDAWFLKPSNTVNGEAFTKNGGIEINGQQIKWMLNTNQSVAEKFMDLINADSAFDTRLKKIEGAYTGGDIITVANMATKITKVGTITQGVWNGTAIDDTHIASAEKWNGYEEKKQNKLTFDTTLSDSTTNVPRSSAVKKYVDDNISTVTAIAQGKTKTYVIDPSASKDGNGVAVINGSFLHGKTDKGEYYTISDSDSKIYTTDEKTISLSSLKVGDIILTTGSKVKDYFLAAISGHDYTFYQLDSDTPDLTGYALKSSLGTAASKAVSTAGPSANGANLVTEAQVRSYVEGKGYITSYTDTTYTFAEGTTNGAFTVTLKGGTAQSVKVHGLAAAAYKGVDTAAFATTSTSANVPTTAAVAGTIANRATKVVIQKAEPTTLQTGDIWIELTN